MGIPGLTTYIENRADHYLKPYELHNTILVIDGWSLSSQLYSNVASCNHAFGGDYDQFAFCVSKFFEDLLKCGVIPLVILDGGWEQKKKLTLIRRAKQRIKIARDYSIRNRTQTLFPLLSPEVFISVMNKLKIKYAMCAFEADDSIASISKLLDVPVLSYDSDFFIYGVNYIPFNTLDPYIIKIENGYVKRCRIFQTNAILNKFKGIDIAVLPLASILLGNDYIDRSTFKGFLDRLRVKGTKNQNEQQRRIEIVLLWLRDHSLNTAIDAILERLPCEKRADILRSIETIVSGYTSISTSMIQLLDIAKITISDIQNNSKPSKFSGELNVSETFHNSICDAESGNCYSGKYARKRDMKKNVQQLHDSSANKEWDAEVFAASVPQWFMNDHLVGRFPVYFINIITNRTYLIPVQIENYERPSAHEISLPIITSICSLLTSTTDSEKDCTVQLLMREGSRLHRRYLTVPLSPITFQNVRDSSEVDRKRIIDSTLKIRVSDKLEELPPSWQLYVAAILFWMRYGRDIKRTAAHLDSLLMSMLIGIIDGSSGSNRMNKMLRRKSLDKLVGESKRQVVARSSCDDKTTVISHLIDAVTDEDCTAALPFFMNEIGIDVKLLRMPKKFSIDIVHVYAQFQSCLRHAMHLNALLGYIYVQPSPNEFLNGTLLYNLCNNFSTRTNIHSYINIKLNNSPGLLKVFMALNQKVLDALEDTKFHEELKKAKRKRHRHQRTQELNEEDGDTNPCTHIEDNISFFDPANLFTMLHDA